MLIKFSSCQFNPLKYLPLVILTSLYDYLTNIFTTRYLKKFLRFGYIHKLTLKLIIILSTVIMALTILFETIFHTS